MEHLTEHSKNSGPWPFSKSICLYCYGDTVGYYHYGTGAIDDHHFVRRFCSNSKCRERALKEINKIAGIDKKDGKI